MFSAWSLVMSMPARIEAMDRPAIYPSRRPSMWLSEENIFWEDIRMRIEPDRMGFCQTLVRLSLDVNELHRNHAPQIAAGSTLDDQPTRCLDPDVPQTSWYVVGGLFACRIPTQPCMSSRRRLATLRISRSGNRQETPLVSIRSVNDWTILMSAVLSLLEKFYISGSFFSLSAHGLREARPYPKVCRVLDK